MTKKILEFPDDADGDALRSVQSNGSDMSKPMLIDFAINAPSETIADLCITRLANRGFKSSKDVSESDGHWTVTVSVIMTPDYDEIVDFQKALDEDLSQLGAKSDGWGAFGNDPQNLPDDLKDALR
jgi:hypothetical protein